MSKKIVTAFADFIQKIEKVSRHTLLLGTKRLNLFNILYIIFKFTDQQRFGPKNFKRRDSEMSQKRIGILSSSQNFMHEIRMVSFSLNFFLFHHEKSV